MAEQKSPLENLMIMSQRLDQLDGQFDWSDEIQQIRAALSHAEWEAQPDYVLDALDNLIHDNYERSYRGAKNRQDDAELIRCALRRSHPAPQVAGLTETAIKSSPAYRALHREKEHLLGLLKEQAPQVAEGHIPVPRALVERWANVDAFQAPKGAAMELKTIAQQMLVNFDAKAPKTAPRVAVPEAVKERMVEAIAEALGDAKDCIRVWTAWGVGTMGPDDFLDVAGDPDRLDEIAEAAITAMFTAAPTAPAGEPVVFPEPQEATTIEEYVGEYEYTDGEGHNYSPTETERALILDAIHGIPDHLLQPPKPAQQPVSDSDGLPDRVLMPRALTAENGAKAALMGEFAFPVTMTCTDCYWSDQEFGKTDHDCEVCGGEIEYQQPQDVPWTTIKKIYAAAVDLLAAPAPDEREIAALLEQLYGTLERATPPADESPEEAVADAMALLSDFMERADKKGGKS